MTKVKILIVEDDPQTAEYLSKGLRQEGFSTDWAENGHEGLLLAGETAFDVIIMDIMLPGIDGIRVIRGLRTRDISTPVLVLSAKGSVDERVEGLRAGGDDYMVKPFSFAELVARLESLVRRSSHREVNTLRIGDISIDRHRHRASIGGVELTLQPREYLLLVYFMRNAGRVLSKSMLLEAVWGFNFDPRTNVVETRISRLRSKLAELSDGDWIVTLRGLGYRFEQPRE